MKTTTKKKSSTRAKADQMIREAGVRITRQRRAVLETIINSCDHPTASMIYARARKKANGLSLATVYNCLETMAEAHVINQLRFDNGPSRYCSNITPHAHVLDNGDNSVLDVHLKPGLSIEDVFDLPEGVVVNHVNIYMHGVLPEDMENAEEAS